MYQQPKLNNKNEEEEEGGEAEEEKNEIKNGRVVSQYLGKFKLKEDFDLIRLSLLLLILL